MIITKKNHVSRFLDLENCQFPARVNKIYRNSDDVKMAQLYLLFNKYYDLRCEYSDLLANAGTLPQFCITYRVKSADLPNDLQRRMHAIIDAYHKNVVQLKKRMKPADLKKYIEKIEGHSITQIGLKIKDNYARINCKTEEFYKMNEAIKNSRLEFLTRVSNDFRKQSLEVLLNDYQKHKTMLQKQIYDLKKNYFAENQKFAYLTSVKELQLFKKENGLVY